MLETIKTILVLVYIVVSIALTVIILSQEGKDGGLSAIAGGTSGGTDTYWSKNKGRSKEGALKKGTVALAILFFAISIVLSLKIWQ